MDVVAFEAIWLKAKRPPISNNNFPYRIEGMTPSIWHTMYKKESNRYHKFSVSCLPCNKVDKIINEIFKCHRSVLSSECSNCQTKSKNAPYLNRALLADIHSKNLNLLTNGKVGGEVKPLRAKAWSNDKNYNKKTNPY